MQEYKKRPFHRRKRGQTRDKGMCELALDMRKMRAKGNDSLYCMKYFPLNPAKEDKCCLAERNNKQSKQGLSCNN